MSSAPFLVPKRFGWFDWFDRLDWFDRFDRCDRFDSVRVEVVEEGQFGSQKVAVKGGER
jgi:hypothetical protein